MSLYFQMNIYKVFLKYAMNFDDNILYNFTDTIVNL